MRKQYDGLDAFKIDLNQSIVASSSQCNLIIERVLNRETMQCEECGSLGFIEEVMYAV